MSDAGRPRALGYTDDFDDWMSHLPDGHQQAIDRHMRAKTITPRIALSPEPGDDRFFSTFVAVEDPRFPRMSYRIDYEVTEMAVIVLMGRRLAQRK